MMIHHKSYDGTVFLHGLFYYSLVCIGFEHDNTTYNTYDTVTQENIRYETIRYDMVELN